MATPIIHPADTLAQVHDSVRVRITSDVADAKIHYTTDNNEPDQNSPLFDHPFFVSKPTTIKAKAYLEGNEPSFVKSNFIDFINPELNGITYRYYEGIWTKLPDFHKQKVVKTGAVYKFGLDQIFPSKDEFALQFEGKIQINKDGMYQFYIQSNDGTKLFIDGKLVINHDGPHGADMEKTGQIHLAKGKHSIGLDYFQAGGGMFLQLKYSGPDVEKQEVPATVLFTK